MTITTNGGRYHVGTIAELAAVLPALQRAGATVQAVSGLQDARQPMPVFTLAGGLFFMLCAYVLGASTILIMVIHAGH